MNFIDTHLCFPDEGDEGPSETSDSEAGLHTPSPPHRLQRKSLFNISSLPPPNAKVTQANSTKAPRVNLRIKGDNKSAYRRILFIYVWRYKFMLLCCCFLLLTIALWNAPKNVRKDVNIIIPTIPYLMTRNILYRRSSNTCGYSGAGDGFWKHFSPPYS